MFLLLLYLFLTVFISFLCSISESVMFSSSIPYVETLATKTKGGKLLKSLKDNMSRPISAILSVNTIANTMGASAVGMQGNELFGSDGAGYISAGLTVTILVFSEIIPKSIGSNYWKTLCVPVAYFVQALYYIAFPLVIITEKLTQIFAKKETQTVSREEIAVLTSIGEKEGVFATSESKIITNLIKLRQIKIRNIMTPRTVVWAVQEDMTLREFFKTKDFKRYSRIPIYSESLDTITGFVLKSDVLYHLANDKDNMQLKQIRRSITCCYEHTSILSFYDTMIARKEHMAMVIDEYGGLEGIVTMEDVIETILGLEITDESDTQIDMQQLAIDQWEKRRQKFFSEKDAEFESILGLEGTEENKN
ncbi:MAG: hemolysin family protein [Paludibacteraceae bacterium]|nr:hemolysin family protein [Paludibacteraceae bacterium]